MLNLFRHLRSIHEVKHESRADLTPCPFIQQAFDRSGHGIFAILTSKVTILKKLKGSKGSMFKAAQGSKFNSSTVQTVQKFKTVHPILSPPCSQVNYGRGRLALSFPFPPYLPPFSRTASDPEDLTMARSIRSRGLRVVRLLASKLQWRRGACLWRNQ